jgi:hypothetical protein
LKNVKRKVATAKPNEEKRLALPVSTEVSRIDLSKYSRAHLAQIVEYRLVEYMAAVGFSYRAMAEQLGLTIPQVSWRVKRGGVSLRAYRDCRTPIAQEIVSRLDAVARRRLVDNLERLLLK